MLFGAGFFYLAKKNPSRMIKTQNSSTKLKVLANHAENKANKSINEGQLK